MINPRGVSTTNDRDSKREDDRPDPRTLPPVDPPPTMGDDGREDGAPVRRRFG